MTSASGPEPPKPDVLADPVQREIAMAFAEEQAAIRYAEFLAQHSIDTCTEFQCGVCGELSRVKADAIKGARDKIVDQLWTDVANVASRVDPDNVDGFVRLLKKHLTDYRMLDVADLW